MTKREKRIEKLRRRPVEADFADVCAVLEDFGWTLCRTSSSHHTFVKPGEMEIFTVPVVGGTRVKQKYLDKLCDLLGLDDLNEE